MAGSSSVDIEAESVVGKEMNTDARHGCYIYKRREAIKTSTLTYHDAVAELKGPAAILGSTRVLSHPSFAFRHAP